MFIANNYLVRIPSSSPWESKNLEEWELFGIPGKNVFGPTYIDISV